MSTRAGHEPGEIAVETGNASGDTATVKMNSLRSGGSVIREPRIQALINSMGFVSLL
ncbi:hypothetical protein [Phreatobacter oligotrophus]|uniref:hypothetical protein n=1 Tax=Phreatobacter oligotrophus TaxID=1122261 RepID=UPI002356C23F|nr:hypothetical protein [Phreatobacter oligotrophus]MBX9990149.1 hypothetical protein [Phreatobacter oligotrophus]